MKFDNTSSASSSSVSKFPFSLIASVKLFVGADDSELINALLSSSFLYVCRALFLFMSSLKPLFPSTLVRRPPLFYKWGDVLHNDQGIIYTGRGCLREFYPPAPSFISVNAGFNRTLSVSAVCSIVFYWKLVLRTSHSLITSIFITSALRPTPSQFVRYDWSQEASNPGCCLWL